ncbi:serine hydrolase domain-containing protein [Streptomyces sp. NPDC004111]|uniref:serine hydrolase domain-containing protein n=1 Tax=Streptomyces sp. NPDC004111 TaxID=3364690 RepID=UPI0036CACFAC
MHMTRYARTKVAGLAVAAVTAATALTAPTAGAAPHPAPAEAVNSASNSGTSTAVDTGHDATRRAMRAVVASGLPGIVVEARDGHGSWRAAEGVGNLRTGAPRDHDERFRTGSIAKTFVATVLLQLEAEGGLDLDDTVERWLPGLVRGNGNDGREITVRQLLNQSSGLFDYLSDEEFRRTYMVGEGFLKHRYDTLPPTARVRAALAHPPVFAPGTRHAYSNTNYVLAALVIERATGHSYESQVRARIINPLGLHATSNPGTGIRLPRPSSRSYGKLFAAKPDRIDDVTEINGSQAWGDGDIVSSTGDLNRFYRALLRGRLLPPGALKAMKTVLPVPEDPTQAYGLGLTRLTTSCGTVLWGHLGQLQGTLSLALTTEDGRHQLAFNTNGDWETRALPDVINGEYCPKGP